MLKIIRSLPPGNADLINQLRRAAISIPLNLAEGAGEIRELDKKRFYSIAHGSASECAAIFSFLNTWELVPSDELRAPRVLLELAAAMVSTLQLVSQMPSLAFMKVLQVRVGACDRPALASHRLPRKAPSPRAPLVARLEVVPRYS